MSPTVKSSSFLFVAMNVSTPEMFAMSELPSFTNIELGIVPVPVFASKLQVTSATASVATVSIITSSVPGAAAGPSHYQILRAIQSVTSDCGARGRGEHDVTRSRDGFGAEGREICAADAAHGHGVAAFEERDVAACLRIATDRRVRDGAVGQSCLGRSDTGDADGAVVESVARLGYPGIRYGDDADAARRRRSAICRIDSGPDETAERVEAALDAIVIGLRGLRDGDRSASRCRGSATGSGSACSVASPPFSNT